MRIADVIRVRREEKGWRPCDLARTLGVSGTQVWRWEKGHTEPGLESLKGLASAFGVSVSSLLDSMGAEGAEGEGAQ